MGRAPNGALFCGHHILGIRPFGRVSPIADKQKARGNSMCRNLHSRSSRRLFAVWVDLQDVTKHGRSDVTLLLHLRPKVLVKLEVNCLVVNVKCCNSGFNGVDHDGAALPTEIATPLLSQLIAKENCSSFGRLPI